MIRLRRRGPDPEQRRQLCLERPVLADGHAGSRGSRSQGIRPDHRPASRSPSAARPAAVPSDRVLATGRGESKLPPRLGSHPPRPHLEWEVGDDEAREGVSPRPPRSITDPPQLVLGGLSRQELAPNEPVSRAGSAGEALHLDLPCFDQRLHGCVCQAKRGTRIEALDRSSRRPALRCRRAVPG